MVSVNRFMNIWYFPPRLGSIRFVRTFPFDACSDGNNLFSPISFLPITLYLYPLRSNNISKMLPIFTSIITMFIVKSKKINCLIPSTVFRSSANWKQQQQTLGEHFIPWNMIWSEGITVSLAIYCGSISLFTEIRMASHLECFLSGFRLLLSQRIETYSNSEVKIETVNFYFRQMKFNSKKL